jgi:pteridine reductase
VKDAIVARTPLRRAAGPDDVADAIVALARSPFVTGTILPVDGGLTLT